MKESQESFPLVYIHESFPPSHMLSWRKVTACKTDGVRLVHAYSQRECVDG